MMNKKGYTLIELIVTFALTAILITAAMMTMGTFMRIFDRVSSMSHAQVVSDTLLETISSQLSFAALANFDGSNRTGSSVEISAQNTVIAYVDKRHTPVIMSWKEDHMLKLAYQEHQKSKSPFVDWYYGREAYAGMEIENLSFEHLSDNFISVTLTLKNPRNEYRFTSGRWIECYNLEEGDIITLP